MRHRQRHLATQLAELTPLRADATSAAEDGLVASTFEALQAAKTKGDLTQVAAAHVQYRLALAAKEKRDLNAELLELRRQPSGAIDLTTTREWVELRSAIMEAMAPYQDARIAVANALVALGA